MDRPHSMPAMFCLIFFLTIISSSFSARTPGNPTSKHHHHHHHHQNRPKMTFLMQNVFNVSHPTPKPATTIVTSQIPFTKPLGYFPPDGGIPLPQSSPTMPFGTVGTASTQTLDVNNIGPLFPARATLQELEIGTVTEFDEYLYKGSSRTSPESFVVGKGQGIFVASSEDGTNHMMAMTASFAEGDFKDGLRFFGVHKTDVHEFHVPVIGGAGKYNGANGFAVIRTVNLGSSSAALEGNRIKNFLLFSIYLR